MVWGEQEKESRNSHKNYQIHFDKFLQSFINIPSLTFSKKLMPQNEKC